MPHSLACNKVAGEPDVIFVDSVQLRAFSPSLFPIAGVDVVLCLLLPLLGPNMECCAYCIPHVCQPIQSIDIFGMDRVFSVQP